LVGFDVSQQHVNLIRRFNSNAQTPDSSITRNWNVSSPNVPVTDYNQPLAIFANAETDNDW
jgi:hypothetical protein